MLRILTLFSLLIVTGVHAQVYICRNGVTRFVSEAPLELIKAQSDKTAGVIDFATKNVAFSIDVDSFEGFNSGLQREHFRENYMETDRYPKATFKGKIIEDIDLAKTGVYNVRAKGIFNIHGTEKEKIVNVKVQVKPREVTVDSTFEVPLEDHNIKIPKIVNQKIASVIQVDVKATLLPKP